jgi:hypothetical protein
VNTLILAAASPCKLLLWQFQSFNDIRSGGKAGFLPLHRAAQQGQITTCELLLYRALQTATAAS